MLAKGWTSGDGAWSLAVDWGTEMALFDKCSDFARWIDSLRERREFFYLRRLDPPASPLVTMGGHRLIMLGSNNYLGLATHPSVVEATRRALEEYGTGACSSRVLTGTTSLHARLERRLAEFKGTEDAVVFSTGFMTMMGTISTLMSEGDVVLSDELNHASIVEGCRLTRAEVRVYRHKDMADLEEKLASCPRRATSSSSLTASSA